MNLLYIFSETGCFCMLHAFARMLYIYGVSGGGTREKKSVDINNVLSTKLVFSVAGVASSCLYNKNLYF